MAAGQRGAPPPPPPPMDANDGLLTVNRLFTAWLTSKNVTFTEEEAPNMAHVWPQWRQNVADMVPKLFK